MFLRFHVFRFTRTLNIEIRSFTYYLQTRTYDSITIQGEGIRSYSTIILKPLIYSAYTKPLPNTLYIL